MKKLSLICLIVCAAVLVTKSDDELPVSAEKDAVAIVVVGAVVVGAVVVACAVLAVLCVVCAVFAVCAVCVGVCVCGVIVVVSDSDSE